MQPTSRWSIRTLLVVLVVTLVVPLASLTTVFAYRDYHARRDLAERDLLASAQAASTGISEFMSDAERMLRALATDGHIRSMNPADCSFHLPSLVTVLSPTFSNVATWRTDGTPICSILPTPEDLDMTDAPGFAEARFSDSLLVSPLQRGRRSGRWSTQITYPIRDENGERIGFLSTPVDLVQFENILASLSTPDSVVLSLTQTDGTVMARSRNAEQWVGHHLSDEVFATSGLDDLPPIGLFRAPSLEGQDFTWSYLRIPGVNWIVSAGRPSEEIYGPLRVLQLRLAFLGALVLLGATLAVRFVYGRVAQPLGELLAGISSARPGEAVELRTDGPQELAWVAERFSQAWNSWHEAEQDREQSHERIRSLVNNAVTGIYVSTEDGRYLEVNQAMVDLLGYASREELLATPVNVTYGSPEIRKGYTERYRDVDSFRGVDAEWIRKDGERIQVRLFGRRMLLRGEGVTWEIIVDDVTEFRRLEQQYLHAQKMEALGRLAGGIAHDFNNILTVVQGQSELLVGDPGLNDEQRSQLTEIYDAAARGSDLNRQLLAFGRRTAAGQGVAELTEVVGGVKLMIQRMIGEGVELRVTLPHTSLWVPLDRSHVEQILMNLCVNARDAMPEGGTLAVEGYALDVTPDEAHSHPGASAGPHVVLAVTDTGSGVPPDILPHIFEPFFSSKPVSSGTGLGLSTVYGIVTGAGGHVTVQSSPEQGSTFRIFLPAYQPESDQIDDDLQTTSAEGPQTGTGTVLISEDEDSVRGLAEQMLRRAGYDVLTASNGREALEVASAHPGSIDVLLTDVVMPEMGGVPLVEHLATEGRIRRVVFFSGYPSGMTEDGPKGMAAWAFVQKPFTRSDLLGAVAEVLKGNGAV